MTLEAPGATFRRTDLDQLQRRGITLEDARHQIEMMLPPPVPEKSRKKKPVVENMALKEFLHEIRRFAFYSDLDRALGGKLASLAEAGEHRPILVTMLAPTGLGFADKPKGLMPFHAYD